MKLAASLALLFSISAASAEAPAHCRAATDAVNLEPFLPLETAEVVVRYSGTALGRPYLDLSPDGSRIAGLDPYANNYKSRRLAILSIGDGTTLVDFDLGAPPFLQFGSTSALRWAVDSKSILAVAQDLEAGSSFAASELKPIRIDLDGNATLLKSVQHAAGTLDGILWVGGDGKAVVQFGMRGGSFRPEKANPSPTYAMADLAEGVIFDTLSVADLPIEQKLLGVIYTSDATSTLMPDGRMRAVIKIPKGLVLWTQGEPFSVIADPYAGEEPTLQQWMQIAPDGRSLLVMRPVSRRVTCPRSPSSEPDGGCRRDEPAEGTLAALVDLTSGEVIWRIDVRDEYASGYPRPAISSDSQFALMGLPATAEGRFLALVDMQSGNILQKIPAPEDINQRGGMNVVGFLGDCAWAYGQGTATFFGPNRAWKR